MEDMIYVISAAVGVLVGRFCYLRIYKNGRTLKQRRAQRWEARGGVADGVLSEAKLLRLGDSCLDTEDLQEDLYQARYHYSAHGATYTVTLRFLRGYPKKVKVYYDPENPRRHIAANEISEVSRRTYGCLACVLLTIVAVGLCAKLLLEFFHIDY